MQRAGQACSPTKSEWDSANAKPYKHTDDCSMKSEGDSAENLIDGGDGVQSLRLDGRKVCNIKGAGISQAESNKATVCALPSIHLPLTREAGVMVRGEGIVQMQNRISTQALTLRISGLECGIWLCNAV